MRLPIMEGETRKRKITNVEYDVVIEEEEEEEEDEDVKMEKFFALIRSAKDIRDQLLDAAADEGSQPRATASKAVAVATEKKAEAARVATTPYKKAEVAPVRAIRKDKGSGAASSDVQNIGVPDALIAYHPSATVAATASGGRGGGSGGARISRGSSEEDHKGKKSAEYKNTTSSNNKNNYQGGKMMLDLNLSL